MNATLYVVGTPIGNREDVTFRAVRILKEVDCIAAEDTRHAKRILEKYHIETPTISFHAHSNPEKILSLLREGKNIALVSDAGTPGISDPGTKLIALAIEEGCIVSPLPGPSAVIAALCASGLPTDRFEFFGFLPQKKGRQTFYKNLIDCDHTAIFYESTHRIEKCVQEMHEYFPGRKIVLARELTKMYEEFLRGTPQEILDIFQEFPEKKKGEFVVLVQGKAVMCVG
jgi:16S rRNA (cytidine1402-2'-O)-methyltransferase